MMTVSWGSAKKRLEYYGQEFPRNVQTIQIFVFLSDMRKITNLQKKFFFSSSFFNGRSNKAEEWVTMQIVVNWMEWRRLGAEEGGEKSTIPICKKLSAKVARAFQCKCCSRDPRLWDQQEQNSVPRRPSPSSLCPSRREWCCNYFSPFQFLPFFFLHPLPLPQWQKLVGTHSTHSLLFNLRTRTAYPLFFCKWRYAHICSTIFRKYSPPSI